MNADQDLYPAGAPTPALRAGGLGGDLGPVCLSALTAVIAHRHAWFTGKVALVLEARGVTVLACTDNGADALDAVLAEQPDIVLAGDHLAGMNGQVLLDEVRRLAPGTLRTIQAAGPQQADALRVGVDAVFLSYQPPGDVADTLVGLLSARRAERRPG